VPWENSNNSTVIRAARAEIARCAASLKLERGELKKDTKLPGGETVGSLMTKGRARIDLDGIIDADQLPSAAAVDTFLAEHAPPVLDPFCGGGSIPLEAQRLGLRVYASDLNPVAVLITKALTEIPAKFADRPPANPGWQSKSDSEKAATVWQRAHGLAEDVRYYGRWMRDEAKKRIGHLYPKVSITAEIAESRPDLKHYVGQELTVVAWLWARSVASPNPVANGGHVPLVRSFWLSTQKGKEAYAQPIFDRTTNTYQFEVRTGTPCGDFDPKKGTVIRTGGTCLLTGSPIPLDHIRAEGKAGRLGAKLMAIVAEGPRGRVYLSPIGDHCAAAESANAHDYPDTDLPKQALGFRVMLYGMDKHYKLFTPRQLAALTTFSTLVQDVWGRVLTDARQAIKTDDHRPIAGGGSGATAYADAIATYLSLGVSKLADYSSSLCGHIPGYGKFRSTFGRQALPMTWDFAELNVFGEAVGNWLNHVEWVAMAIDEVPATAPACVRNRDARSIAADLNETTVISTDPP